MNHARLIFRLQPLVFLTCGNGANTQEHLVAKFGDGDTAPPTVTVTPHASGAYALKIKG